MTKSYVFALLFLTLLSTKAFSQKSDKPQDPLSTDKQEMTLLKDGSEKKHIKPKARATAIPTGEPKDVPPSTKGLPTDVD